MVVAPNASSRVFKQPVASIADVFRHGPSLSVTIHPALSKWSPLSTVSSAKSVKPGKAVRYARLMCCSTCCVKPKHLRGLTVQKEAQRVTQLYKARRQSSGYDFDALNDNCEVCPQWRLYLYPCSLP
jgi:hypothetical protein